MTFRRIKSHNPNNILLKEFQNKLSDFHLKMDMTSLIVFIIVFICLCIIIFSAFIIVELVLYPIENEIDDSNNIQLIYNKIEKMKKHNNSNLQEVVDIHKKLD
jgi:hypothetical protein